MGRSLSLRIVSRKDRIEKYPNYRDSQVVVVDSSHCHSDLLASGLVWSMMEFESLSATNVDPFQALEMGNSGLVDAFVSQVGVEIGLTNNLG